ncbi:MAG TPA: chemotaxis protein CheB [Allosphingosinicella sp.]|jgi:two-component system chemotaxis response regulator CheB|nr:chemotaxis protein CheB [Allosphingosinicella sp.]
MIVDDSAVARSVLARMLAPFADFEVVAAAASAEEAVGLLGRHKVDVVLLDLDMPGSGGLEALPAIIDKGAGARVLVVSSSTESGSETAVRALALGAADTLAKPGTQQAAGGFSAALAERLRRLVPGSVPVAEPVTPLIAVQSSAGPAKIGCLAVGASTGGLHAISQFLQGLPARIGSPVLITQHLPSTFLPLFARQVETACGHHVRVAHDGMILRNDEILLAPGDRHLGLERHGGRVKVRLLSEPAESGCTPSVDVMLDAVARIYGKAGVGVVLSGMGRDGFAGGRKLVEAGGHILVQDQASSAVWGMPRALAGLACCVDNPAALARQIGAWTKPRS